MNLSDFIKSSLEDYSFLLRNLKPKRPVGQGMQKEGQEPSLLWPGVFLCPCYWMPQNTKAASLVEWLLFGPCTAL